MGMLDAAKYKAERLHITPRCRGCMRCIIKDPMADFGETSASAVERIVLLVGSVPCCRPAARSYPKPIKEINTQGYVKRYMNTKFAVAGANRSF